MLKIEKKSIILALGVANSGKSHTILGDLEEKQGLLPKIIGNLQQMRLNFSERKAKNSEFFVRKEDFEDYMLNNEMLAFDDFNLSLEAFEIYNEEVFDLANKTLSKNNRPELYEFNKKVYVQSNIFNIIVSFKVFLDITNNELNDPEKTQELLGKILKNRKTASLSNNLTSSRSHAFFKLIISMKYVTQNNEIKEINVPILFVDLAGIYKANKTEDLTTVTLKENCNINKSVFFLNRSLGIYLCNETSKNNNNQIDFFRESKLTMVIYEYLIDQNVNKSLIFHINGKNQMVDFKETQTLLEDVGIFAEKIEKKPTSEVDPIKEEVKKSLKKSEKNLNNLVENMKNISQDGQGEYLSKYM